jgi:hypothetical protein
MHDTGHGDNCPEMLIVALQTVAIPLYLILYSSEFGIKFLDKIISCK